jgi:ABC-type multidrug transport system permease subunit
VTATLALFAICRQTVEVWLRNWSLMAASLVPPVAFLAAGFFAAAAVSHSPVALVNLDHGADGLQLAQIFHNSDLFRVVDTDPEQAHSRLKNLQAAAVITIPADFTERVARRQAVPIDFEVNNLNLDFTNDIRRSVPTAITDFYAAKGSASPIAIQMQERDLRSQDIELFQYEVMPVLVLMILITALVNTAVSTAKEYESRTIREILLSPVAAPTIVAGKILAGSIIGIGCGLVEVGICLFFGWMQAPQGSLWVVTLGIICLTAMLAASAGFAVGVWIKKVQAAHALATNTALPLFFLAGGVGVLAFEPHWLQTLALFVPLTYANHALQMAVFYHSTDLLGRDVAVLVGVTLAAVALAVVAFRKSRSNSI